MHIKVLKEDIIEGLQKASNIIPMKTGAAFLRTIWLRSDSAKLSIMATDSSIEFMGSYNAHVLEDGIIGVQGKKFSELIKKMPAGEITLKVNSGDNNLLIQQGKRKYKLPTNDSSWFQDFNTFPEENPVLWSGDYLKEIIDKIYFCISDDETTQGMTCINFSKVDEENIEACGLNGHQFALLSFKNAELGAIIPENGFMVSKKYLNEIKKLISSDEIEVSISDKRLFIRSNNNKESLSLPLNSYIFPDYNNLLEQYKEKFSSSMLVDKFDLIDALNRILIFNTEANKSTFFHFQGESLHMYSQGQDIGEASENIEIQFEGQLEKIALPTRVLLDILSHFNSKTISFDFSGDFDPCKITGNDDPEYMVITMPVEVVEETYYTEEEI